MSRPVAEGLFTEGPDGPVLVGGHCAACGTTTFPRQDSCPKCTAADIQELLLPRTGTLWSFTVQAFPPKPPYRGPEPFEPFGVGYVELDGVIVEARLTENDPAKLRIGDPMVLVLEPFAQDDDGTPIITFAFAPRP